jgi:short-subunit dehydrogenase
MKKLAVITGGTQGIGKALVEAFAAEGLSIATCSRNEDELRQLQKEVTITYPDIDFFVKPADLSVKVAVKDFAAWVLSHNIPVEVLVNNAGLFIPGQIHNEEDGVLETMIQTNLYSAYYLTKGLISGMKERKYGHIFNICSTASITAYENGGSYGISKFGLLGMSKVLREEMKPFNVRVTSVIPGATYTNSWKGTDLPEERFMKAEDVAEMVLATYKISERAVVEEMLIRPFLGDI